MERRQKPVLKPSYKHFINYFIKGSVEIIPEQIVRWPTWCDLNNHDKILSSPNVLFTCLFTDEIPVPLNKYFNSTNRDNIEQRHFDVYKMLV